MTAFGVVTQEARARRTVVLTAREKDGSVETREAEPYSLRSGPSGMRLFYFCLRRNGIRNCYLSDLLDAVPTGRYFAPRWPVEL